MNWFSIKHLDQGGGVWVGLSTFAIILLWFLESLGWVTVGEWIPSCYKFILGAFAISRPAKVLLERKKEV